MGAGRRGGKRLRSTVRPADRGKAAVWGVARRAACSADRPGTGIQREDMLEAAGRQMVRATAGRVR
jgi:hypothetical protein